MNNSLPLVSVLMNCRNGDKYLREAISSVYTQTYKNWELIFVDNMSTDQTYDVIKEFDSKLRYFSTKKFMSLGQARNFGLSKCCGKYISFLDTDDIWVPEKLCLQVKYLERNKDIKIAYSSGYYLDENSKVIGCFQTKYETQNNLLDNLANYEVNIQSLIFERSILDKNKKIKFDEKLNHSEDFYFFLTISHNNFVYPERKKLVKYRLHDGQHSKKSYILWYQENNYVYQQLKNNYPFLFKSNPDTILKFRAKIAYYKCRAIANRELLGVIRIELFPYKHINLKYKILYYSSFCLPLWNFLHFFKKM